MKKRQVFHQLFPSLYFFSILVVVIISLVVQPLIAQEAADTLVTEQVPEDLTDQPVPEPVEEITEILPLPPGPELSLTGKLPEGTTRWTEASKIMITGEVILGRRDSLYIERGVRIEMGASATLTLQGFVDARGDENYPLIITRADPDSAWARILFSGKCKSEYDADGNFTGGSIFEWAEIDGGGFFSLGYSEGMILCSGSGGSPYLNNLRLSGGLSLNGGGLAIVNGASPRIENCVIYGNEATGNGGGVYLGLNANAVMINNLVLHNKAGRDGGGVYVSFSPSTIERNIIQENHAVRDGGALSMSGSTPTVINNVFKHNTADKDGDNLLIYSGCEARIVNNSFLVEEGGINIASSGGTGDPSEDIIAVNNYWGKNDIIAIRAGRLGRQLDTSRPGIVIEPYLEAPLDNTPLHCARIDSVEIYEDQEYTRLMVTEYVGFETPLFLQVLGEGKYPEIKEWAMVDFFASGGDEIRALIEETEINSNIFRIMALTDNFRDPDRAIISTKVGETLSLEPVGFEEKSLKFPLKKQQPFVRDPILVGVKDLDHLIDDEVWVNWTYKEPKLRTQKQTRLTVLDTLENVFWTSGDEVNGEHAVQYRGQPFTPGEDFIIRVEATNGIAWSRPADVRFHRNKLPSIPVITYPMEDQVLLTRSPALVLFSEVDPETDSLNAFIEITAEAKPGEIIQESGWLPTIQQGDSVRHETLEIMNLDLTRVPARSWGVVPIELDSLNWPLSSVWYLSDPLRDNTVYNTRAMLTDGWETTDNTENLRFIVNLFNDTPADYEITWPQQYDELLPSDKILWTIPFDPDPEDILTYTITLGAAGGITRDTSFTAGELDRVNLLVDDAEVPLTVLVHDLEDSMSVAADSARRVYYNAENDTPTVPTGFEFAGSKLITDYPPAINWAEGELVEGFPAQLSWTASTDEDHSDPSSSLEYEIDIKRIWGEDVVVLRTEAGNTSMSMDPVPDNTLAVWRVRSLDNEETPSAWSPPKLLEVNAMNDTPTVPTGFTLSDSQIVREVPADLSWDASTDADESDPSSSLEYEVELTRIWGDELAVLRTSPGQTMIDLDPVEDNMLVYWRTRSLDNANLASAWSTRTLLEVNRYNDIPTIPTGFSLDDSQRVMVYPAELTWDESSDLDESDPPSTIFYEVLLKREDGTLIDTLRTEQGITGMSLDPVEDNSRATWQVRAIDNEKGTSEWGISGTLELNIKDDNPDPFVLTAPVNNATPYRLGPTTFSWGESTDPDPLNTVEYTLLLSTSSSFSSSEIVAENITDDLTAIHMQDLEHLVDYFWRVKATDNTGLDTWSDTFEFKVISTPTIPEWTEPLPSEIKPGFSIQWQASTDPDPEDILEYRIEISSSEDFNENQTAFADQLSGTSFGFSSVNGVEDVLTDDGTVVIRIKSRDDQGFESGWSLVESSFINFENDIPEIPQVVEPKETRLDKTKPVFKWLESADADYSDPPSTMRYDIHVALESSPDQAVAFGTDTVKVKTEWKPSKNIPDNSRFVWKIRSIDDEGTASDWSELIPFSIDRKPESPEPFLLISPVDDAQILPDQPITFRWNSAIDNDLDSSVKYYLVIGDNQYGPMDETEHNLREGLPAEKYKWRVIAEDNTGLTRNSKWFKMVVGTGE